MASHTATARGMSVFRISVQILFVAATFALWHAPLLMPIKLLVVLLHEISHGLVALATGGTVENVIITPNEGGACETNGGNAALIMNAGYLGSIFFGGLILSASRSRGSSRTMYGCLALLLFGAALTVIRDAYSRNFAIAVALSMACIGILAPAVLSSFVLRFVGTVSCFYVIFDIYNDILSHSAVETNMQSDASAFSELSGFPPSLVGLAWLALSGAYSLVMLKSSLGVPAEPLQPSLRQAAPKAQAGTA